MTWNYRIVKIGKRYEVRECFYEAKQIRFIAETPVSLWDTRLSWLKTDLNNILTDANKHSVVDFAKWKAGLKKRKK